MINAWELMKTRVYDPKSGETRMGSEPSQEIRENTTRADEQPSVATFRPGFMYRTDQAGGRHEGAGAN
jgi:hypothetical protein